VLNLIDSPKINFDSKTAGLRAYEASVDSLTASSSFGGCTVVTSCRDVDDFDGLSITGTKQGLAYRASIDVDYVSRTNPDSVVSSPTMSKRVTVTVSSTSVFVASDSVSGVISRIIPYR